MEATMASSGKEDLGPEDFRCLKILGKGSFGHVYLVQKVDEPDTQKNQYAMKILPKKKLYDHNLVRYAMTEKHIMSVVDHPFIIKMRFTFETQDKLYFILDYCPGGDLSEYLNIERSFTEKKARFYVAEILLAIEELHT